MSNEKKFILLTADPAAFGTLAQINQIRRIYREKTEGKYPFSIKTEYHSGTTTDIGSLLNFKTEKERDERFKKLIDTIGYISIDNLSENKESKLNLNDLT